MADEIALLFQLAVDARGRVPREELLQSLVDTASELLGVVRVSAYLLDESRAQLGSVARAGMPVHRTSVEYRPGEGLIGWIAERREAIRTGDAEADPRFLQRQTMTVRIGSFVGVPLVVADKGIGVLGATHPDPDHFSAHHEALLTIAAGLCAPVLGAPAPPPA